MDVRPTLYALLFSVCFSGLALFGQPLATSDGMPPDPSKAVAPMKILDLAGVATVAYGTGYLVVLLVAWRLWLHFRPRSAFTWSFVVPLLVFLPPAAPLACGLTTKLPEFAIGLWIWTGAAGISPGVALLLLGIEIFARVKLSQPFDPFPARRSSASTIPVRKRPFSIRARASRIR